MPFSYFLQIAVIILATAIPLFCRLSVKLDGCPVRIFQPYRFTVISPDACHPDCPYPSIPSSPYSAGFSGMCMRIGQTICLAFSVFCCVPSAYPAAFPSVQFTYRFAICMTSEVRFSSSLSGCFSFVVSSLVFRISLRLLFCHLACWKIINPCVDCQSGACHPDCSYHSIPF